MKTKLLCALLAAASLLLAGCDFEAPLTTRPTRLVEPRLPGDWARYDESEQTLERMTVRQLDDSTYIIVYEGDLYRAYHSDFADRPFVTVQELKTDERKYCYYLWKLSDDGRKLTLRRVSTAIIPGDTKDTRTIQQLIRAKLDEPGLFAEPVEFTRKRK